MATDLIKSLEKLHFSSQSQSRDGDECIDTYLTESRPRNHTRKTFEEIKKDLEEEFLTPSTTFSIEWLNKLQEYVEHLLYALPLTKLQEMGDAAKLQRPL